MNKEIRTLLALLVIIVISLSLVPFVARAIFETYNPYYTFRDAVMASLLALVWIGIVTLLVVTTKVYSYRSSEERVLKSLQDSLNEIQERLKVLEGGEIKDTTHERLSKIFLELDKALRGSAVMLRCPQHPDAEVSILSDGSLWCKAGHYVWLSEDLKQLLAKTLEEGK